MALQWNAQDPANVLDNVTNFRLNHSDKMSADPVGVWWSAIVVLTGTTVIAFDESLGSSFTSQYLIPDEYDDDDGEDIMLTIYAQAAVMRQLNTVDNSYGVTEIHLGSIISGPMIDPATSPGIGTDDDPDEVILSSDGTVTMAVIDDGIAFGHNLFRSGLETTRVEGMFIMDAYVPGAGDVGIKLRKSKIDELLALHTHSGLLDEESFYSAAGSINRAQRFFSTTTFRRSHGTHVMSLAAGYEMTDAPDNRPIIGVQLPTRVTEDTSGSNLAPSLRSAIRYILRQSRKIRIGGKNGPIAPLVVNFSYGNLAGPHDGTGLIARIIDRELKSTPDQEIRVILPAGNSNLSRCHAAVSFDGSAGGDRVALDLRIYPDDYTCNYVQMWMPYSDDPTPPDYVNVRVTPPNSTQSMAVSATLGAKQELHNEFGEVVAVLAYEMEPAPTKRGLITLSTNPTSSQKSSTKLAPSGKWVIELEQGAIADDQHIEVRIERDETLPGYPPFGRQAYFDNACYVRFDEFGAPLAVDPPDSECPIRRAGTLNGFATGKLPLVIAAFTQSNGLMSDYSSAGPISAKRGTTVPNRIGPDASARADDSPVLYGVLAAGTRSGSMVRMNGTSVSAPLVARYIADGLGGGHPADRNWLWGCASYSDSHHHFPQPKPSDTRTGGGRLDLPYPFPPGPAEV
jgi:hypothetical protein